MTVYLEALNLWEAIEEDYEMTPLPANPTVAQREENKEVQSQSQPIFCCFKYHIHKNGEFAVGEGYLGLP